MDAVRTPSLARWETLLSPASGFPVRKSGLALHQRLVSRFDYLSGFVTTDSRAPQREPALSLWTRSDSVNACAAVRPQPADLDSFGVPEWSWDACLPALCRIEDDAEFGHEPWHGTGGPIRVERRTLDRAAATTRAFHEACLDAGYKDCPDQNSPGATVMPRSRMAV